MNINTNAKIKSIDEKNYTLECIGTAEVIDRHGDIVDVETMSLENYQSNPVVLPFHSYGELPVGKTVSLEKTVLDGVKVILFKIKFAVEEYELAKTMFDMYKNSYINAFSIGFRVGEVQSDAKTGAARLMNCELLEISAVSVPANQLALAKSAGVDVKSYVSAMPQQELKDSLSKAVLEIKSLVDDIETGSEEEKLEEEKEIEEPKEEEKPEELDEEKKSAILKKEDTKVKLKQILSRAVRNLNHS